MDYCVLFAASYDIILRGTNAQFFRSHGRGLTPLDTGDKIMAETSDYFGVGGIGLNDNDPETLAENGLVSVRLAKPRTTGSAPSYVYGYALPPGPPAPEHRRTYRETPTRLGCNHATTASVKSTPKWKSPISRETAAFIPTSR